ncbi:hypothetical protein TFLX_00871 [Thermoflexales bacterium]|nr:hypothetical protein TFLX_00871 [Thermoflexales bacterium]
MLLHEILCLLFSLGLLALTACASPPPGTPLATRSATLASSAATTSNSPAGTETPKPITCADLESAWAVNDWATVLDVLHQLRPSQAGLWRANLTPKPALGSLPLNARP